MVVVVVGTGGSEGVEYISRKVNTSHLMPPPHCMQMKTLVQVSRVESQGGRKGRKNMSEGGAERWRLKSEERCLWRGGEKEINE